MTVVLSDQLFHDLDWNKLNHQHNARKMFTMYKAVNNQTPGYLKILFYPASNTNYGKRSCSYSGAVLWNSLPNDIKQSIFFFFFNLNIFIYMFAPRAK